MLVLITCKFDEDPIKMKALSCPQHFLRYKSVGKFFIAQGQVTQKQFVRPSPKSKYAFPRYQQD